MVDAGDVDVEWRRGMIGDKGWVSEGIRFGAAEWLGDQYADGQERSITVFGSDIIGSRWG